MADRDSLPSKSLATRHFEAVLVAARVRAIFAQRLASIGSTLVWPAGSGEFGVLYLPGGCGELLRREIFVNQFAQVLEKAVFFTSVNIRSAAYGFKQIILNPRNYGDCAV